MKALLIFDFSRYGGFLRYQDRASAYVGDYALQDFLSQTAVEASVHQPQGRPEDLQKEIYSKAESLGLPVERHGIRVLVGQTVLISVN